VVFLVGFWPTFQQLKVVVFRVLGWACSRV
jgi:hypothetical protein